MKKSYRILTGKVTPERMVSATEKLLEGQPSYFTNVCVHRTRSAFRCNVFFAFHILFTTKDTKKLQNESLDTIFQFRNVEVDQQTRLDAGQLHVGE